MNKVLETPTNELIAKYAENIARIEKYKTGDRAIKQLIKSCSPCKNLEKVWLKVIVINSLYSAGVIDTFKMHGIFIRT